MPHARGGGKTIAARAVTRGKVLRLANNDEPTGADGRFQGEGRTELGLCWELAYLEAHQKEARF